MKSSITNKRFIFAIFLLILTFHPNYSAEILYDNNISLNNIITTIDKDSEQDLREAVKYLNKNGGIIYIDTPVININIDSIIELMGEFSGGIIGKKQSNNEYPRIDFKKVREEFDFKSISQAMISITGSNKFLKYLIIENSASYGINISGNKTTLDHIITRYNNFPGISLYKAKDTTLNYCYSYRNFGQNSNGKLGTGFAIDLGSSSNVIFKYCFAWDNSNDGWLSFIYNGQTDRSESVSFLHSGGWNNGNLDVFTGKYDYDKGKALDKKLWSVQELINSDENFETNYKNKNFNIDNGKINRENAKEWLAKSKGYIDGNGFEFQSVNTLDIQKSKRVFDYSTVFDNKSRGFNNNNNYKCNGYFTNCVSFNNNVNYQSSYNFVKWLNNWSWGSKKNDQIDIDVIVKKPSNSNSAQKLFYSVRDQIIKTATSNKFNDNFNFDIPITKLN